MSFNQFYNGLKILIEYIGLFIIILFREKKYFFFFFNLYIIKNNFFNFIKQLINLNYFLKFEF